MALENLISVEFTPAEQTALDNAFSAIKTVFDGKVINLTPEQRQQYGRIGNKTENWIAKVNTYMTDNPTLMPNYINKPEFDKDFATRMVIAPRLNKLAQLFEQLDDTQKLISSDLYGNAIAFYRHVKIASEQNVPGSTAIYDDLKAQFPRIGKKDTP